MDAIERQNVAHDNVAREDEFVVIDNGSSDEDAPLASTYQQQLLEATEEKNAAAAPAQAEQEGSLERQPIAEK